MLQVADQGGQRLVQLGQQAGVQCAEVVAVRVPAAQAHGDEADARLDQPPGRQHALSKGRLAVGFAHRAGLLVDVERAGRTVGAQDVDGLLLKAIQAGRHVIERGQVSPEALLQVAAQGELADRKAVRQGDAVELPPAATARRGGHLKGVVGDAQISRGAGKAAHAGVVEQHVGGNAGIGR